MKVISEFIKQNRKALGLTQEEFAIRAGLGLHFVRELEQGKKTLRLDKVNQALAVFGAQVSVGRLMSRTTAFERLTMEEYKKEMQGIYSTCINTATLDESPMAYKSMDDIIEFVQPTVEVVIRIKPIYNFKASE